MFCQVFQAVMTHSNFYSLLKKIWWTWGNFMQMNSVNDPTVSSKLKPPPLSRSINLQPKQNYCHGREGNKKFMTDLKRGSWGCVSLWKNIRIFPKLIGRNRIQSPKEPLAIYLIFLAPQLEKGVCFQAYVWHAFAVSLPILEVRRLDF